MKTFKKLGSKRVWIVVGLVLAVVLAIVLRRASREHYEAVDETKLKNKLDKFCRAVHKSLSGPGPNQKNLNASFENIQPTAKTLKSIWDGSIGLYNEEEIALRNKKFMLPRKRLFSTFPPNSTRPTGGTGVDIQAVRMAVIFGLVQFTAASLKARGYENENELTKFFAYLVASASGKGFAISADTPRYTSSTDNVRGPGKYT